MLLIGRHVYDRRDWRKGEIIRYRPRGALLVRLDDGTDRHLPKEFIRINRRMPKPRKKSAPYLAGIKRRMQQGFGDLNT